MDAREMIRKYLVDNGFDGLYEPGECGCELADLMPCDSAGALNCRAGYKTECDCYGGDEHGFHIGPRAPNSD